MSGWIHDPETNKMVDYLTAVRKNLERTRREEVKKLVDALLEAFTYLELTVDLKTGKIIITKKVSQ